MGFRKSLSWPVVKLLDWSGKEEELEKNDNPFALLTLGHLKAKETQGNDEARAQWKERLLKGLTGRKLDLADMRRWDRFLDFLLTLPAEYNQRIWQNVEAYAKEKQMPFVTYAEQYYGEKGEARGLQEGIETALELRFAQAGLDLMPQVRQLGDPERLRAFLQAIRTGATLDTLRALLPAAHGQPSGAN